LKPDFDINKLIRGIIEDYLLSVNGQFINFEAAGAIIVKAECEKISSVISNILNVEVKYSDKEKAITINCVTGISNVIFSVRDYCLDIKNKDLEKIFERQYRVKDDFTQHINWLA
jgi:two-component system sensor histidine kinase VicK